MSVFTTLNGLSLQDILFTSQRPALGINSAPAYRNHHFRYFGSMRRAIRQNTCRAWRKRMSLQPQLAIPLRSNGVYPLSPGSQPCLQYPIPRQRFVNSIGFDRLHPLLREQFDLQALSDSFLMSSIAAAKNARASPCPQPCAHFRSMPR